MKLINFLLFLMLSSDQVQGSIKTIELNVSTGGNLSFFLTEDELHKDSRPFSLFFNSNTIATFYPDGRPPNVTKNYTGRLDVSSGKSVTLMNMQESDSGLYSAEVTEQTEPFKQCKVIVQDPVSPVNLTDSMCNINTRECTVTCSTGDFNISGTLRCSKETWHLEGGERSEITNTGASISLYQSGSSIICNHSNNVSQNQANVTTQPYSSSEESTTLYAILGVCGSVLAAGVLFILKKYPSSGGSRGYQLVASVILKCFHKLRQPVHGRIGQQFAAIPQN